MGTNGDTNGVVLWKVLSLPRNHLRRLVVDIRKHKKCGSLTVNFNQGGVSRLEWKERVKPECHETPDISGT